jgi:hypothetical protein
LLYTNDQAGDGAQVRGCRAGASTRVEPAITSERLNADNNTQVVHSLPTDVWSKGDVQP